MSYSQFDIEGVRVSFGITIRETVGTFADTALSSNVKYNM